MTSETNSGPLSLKIILLWLLTLAGLVTSVAVDSVGTAGLVLSAAAVTVLAFVGHRQKSAETRFSRSITAGSKDQTVDDLSTLSTQLSRSEERYKSFVSLSTEGIWRAELTAPVSIQLPVHKQVEAIFYYAYLAECNDAMARMYGYERAEQLTGIKVREILVPDDARNHDYLAAFVSSNYQLTGAESHEIGADGQSVYFLNSLIGVVENGFLVRGWGTQRDITEFKRQAEELSMASEKLKAIIDSSDDAILSKSLDGTIQTWNAGAERMFGYTAYEAIGRSVMMLIPEDRRDEEQNILDTIAGGRRVDHLETARVRKDGSRIFVSVSTAPVMNDAGEIIGASKIARDITERVRHQEILVESESRYRLLAHERNQLLEQERSIRASMELANRLKDEFLLTLSHELRTPLNAILGWAQLISRQGFNGERLKEGLSVIERNARAQAKMIDDLLDMNRIISGKIRLNIGEIDMPGLIQASMESIAATAVAKNIKIEATIGPNIGKVAADAARLSQVLWNLLTNAIKYTQSGGIVRVTMARDESDIKIAVQDSGEGIAPEFLPLVFERFRQADASITRKHGGLGLGLSIVRQLVELHGGRVEAFSEGLGKGATFTVTFPAVRPTEQAGNDESDFTGTANEIANPAPTSTSILKGRSILVVDDEKDARDLLRVILEEHGATVVTVGSVNEAITFLSNGHVDLVVSDIGMPEEDGYQLMRKLRQLPPERGGRVPAIAVTAFTRHEDRLRSLDAGFKYHVAKPVNPSELISYIGKVHAECSHKGLI